MVPAKFLADDYGTAQMGIDLLYMAFTAEVKMKTIRVSREPDPM